MTIEQKERMLKLKVNVMRQSGLTLERVTRNAKESRRILTRSEEEIERDSPRLQVAS